MSRRPHPHSTTQPVAPSKPHSTQDDLTISTAPIPRVWERPETHASSQLLLAVGGLRDVVIQGENPSQALTRLAASIDEYFTRDSTAAEPPPADIQAAFRLTDYFLKTNGDVFQTIQVPGEILLKEVTYTCDDDTAKKQWDALWHGTFDIDSLFEEFFFETETYGQCFPLEVWDEAGKTPVGIAMLEPSSVWVGRHITLNDPQFAIMTPQDFEVAKLKDMIHPAVYNSFSPDLNTQTSGIFRVPIRPDRLHPIYGRKFAFQRYAIPPVIRASRNIMHRQILDELRRGTIEGYINQLILFTVGSEKDSSAQITTKVKNLNNRLTAASANRTGVLVADYTTKADVVAPKVVDQLLATEAWKELTQAIFRDLGMSMFVVSGEVPGGTRGGSGVEVDVQFAIERWKYKRRRSLSWLTYFSDKFAKANDTALLKHLPVFSAGQIGVEQTQAIKERIMPFLQAGALSLKTGLKDGGYSFDIELANKKDEAPYSEYFQARPTFSQTAVNSDGERRNATYSPRGKPPEAQSPTRLKRMAKAALEASVPSLDDWSGEIEAVFAATRDGHMDTFATWLRAALTQRFDAAYRNGFAHGGGVGEVNTLILNDSPQGLRFHLSHLDQMVARLHTADPAARDAFRSRARMYASASRTAYILGYQQAMQSHGAKFWQRLLHPELSTEGPCVDCIGDAAVIHPIDEPFFELHPHAVCSIQSVQFHYGDRAPVSVPWPVTRGKRIIRRFPLGASQTEEEDDESMA